MIKLHRLLNSNPHKALLSLGVTSELSFLDRKKTEVINIMMFLSIPLMLYFIVTNYMEKRTILVLGNTFNLICSIVILILNQNQKYKAGRIIISLGFLVSFTFQAILYRSGAEYFIIANLVGSLILYNEKKTIYFMAFINCLAILIIQYFKITGYVYQTVPPIKVIFNTGIGLTLSAVALLYFLFEESSHTTEIEKCNTELEVLNKTKEKLFSIIAHDLRSPLAQLKGSIWLVNSTGITKEEFTSMTDKISRQIDYMQSNLEELLQWSKSQMSGIVASPKIVSLRAITEEVIDLIKAQSDAKNIEIIDQIGDNMIWIDPDHLKLVLRNIISNAIKFSYTGGNVEIEAKEDTNEVHIHIRDYGIGMTSEEIEQLFSTNIRSTKGTAQEPGTGLGLKLCKEFLNKSGSQLHVESVKGKGSTIIISIPLKG